MQYLDTTAIDAVNKGIDTPDAFYYKSTLIATSQYVSNDAWRGHSEIKPEPGFKLLTDDWVTGNWSDAPDGNSSDDVESKIAKLEAEHKEVFVIFTPTSNVFSTAYAVLVRDAEAKINKGKLIGHKTRKFTEDNGDWRVRYHATDVISYNAKTGKYTLNTGGWNTMTTSKRMTDHLPTGYYVYRRNWIMYVHTPDGDLELKDEMEV